MLELNQQQHADCNSSADPKFIFLCILRKTRKFAKKVFNDSYFEIYVNCSLKTLERRDTKGLYKRAKKNLVKNLIGYNSNVKYQKSYYSIININTDRNKIKKCIKKITDKIL